MVTSIGPGKRVMSASAPVILLLMIAVLGFTVYKSFRKGLELWRKERAAAEAAPAAAGASPPPSPSRGLGAEVLELIEAEILDAMR